MPLHVLVEEGKHATSPDRNADGLYSPGYDVNRRTPDAWGIRDTLRNRRQGGATFHAEGLKSRSARPVRAKPRFGEPTLAVAQYRGSFVPTTRAVIESRVTSSTEAPPVQRDTVDYDLYEGGVAATESYCTGAGGVSPRLNGEGTKELYRMLTRWGFCAFTEARGQRKDIEFFRSTGPQGPGNRTFGDRLAVAWTTHAGVDGGAVTGISTNAMFGLRVPLVEGWLVPQGVFLWQRGSWATTHFAQRSRQSVELLYLPSASRAADWYIAVAGQRDRRDNDVTWTGVQEVGVKFRAPKTFPLTMNSMVSARIGYRGSLHRGLGDGHWTLQVGIGGW